MKSDDHRVLNGILHSNCDHVWIQIAGFYNKMLQLKEKWRDRDEGFLIASLLLGNILIAVTILESLVNLLASLTIEISKGGVALEHSNLSQAEIDFLAEEQMIFDAKSGLSLRKDKRTRTEDRMYWAPILFFKTISVDFKIDKST